MNDLRMPDVNTVLIAGNLTRDPSFRRTTNGTPVANFWIASNRKFKDNTGQWRESVCYVGVVAWYKLAETCAENLHRGSAVLIEGELQSRSLRSEDGRNRNIVEIKARRIQFLNKKDNSEEGDFDLDHPRNENESSEESSQTNVPDEVHEEISEVNASSDFKDENSEANASSDINKESSETDKTSEIQKESSEVSETGDANEESSESDTSNNINEESSETDKLDDVDESEELSKSEDDQNTSQDKTDQNKQAPEEDNPMKGKFDFGYQDI
ncbi:single-stranded DNA-binding protein [bacterium]